MGVSGGHGAVVVGVCLLALVAMASIDSVHAKLSPDYYVKKCPKIDVYSIVKEKIKEAVAADIRMAASLVRLHFHDCFVNGCDASVLLDNAPGIDSEKFSLANNNSLRGFAVIDNIKAALEKACPRTVSCADILAIAYRDSAVEVGLVPEYQVELGRRDGTTANRKDADKFLPGPNMNYTELTQNFATVSLDETDLVALSGAHTIGLIRCSVVNRTRSTTEKVPSSNTNFLKSVCPEGLVRTSLDFESETKFDNNYFHNLRLGRGVIASDQVLYNTHGTGGFALVRDYAESQEKFFRQFATSSIKMGRLKVLEGKTGEVQSEIRQNCHVVNKKSYIAYE